VAETPDKETQEDKQPEPSQQRASRRVPAMVVSLLALAVIGAAIANILPNSYRFSLPNFSRFAAQLPHETASARIPDSAVNATLKDIQLSQQQNAAALLSLTQNAATQQADLKRISRQLSSLAAQADAQQQNAVVLVSLMQNSVTQQADLKRISRQLSSLPQADASQNAEIPLTTSSIPHSNTRAGVVGTSRKIISPLPKPVGPVSVGGAPLGPAPAPGSGKG
jgi:predicted transcriptional regulator